MNTRCFAAVAITAVIFAGGLHVTAPAIAQEPATPQAAPVASPAARPPRMSSGGDDALRFARAKISDDVTLAFIQNDDRRYALSASEIIYLRQEGVSDRVLTAMINHQSGASAAPAANTGDQPYVGPMARIPAADNAPTSTVYVATSALAYPTYYSFYDPYPFWYDPWPYYYPYYSLSFCWSWGWGGCYSGYYGYYGCHGWDGHSGHLHATPAAGIQTASPTRTATARAGGSRGVRQGIATTSPGGANTRSTPGPGSGQVGSQSSGAASVSRAPTAGAGRVASPSGTMSPGGFRGGSGSGMTTAPRMSGGGGGGGFSGGGGSRGGGGSVGGGGGGHR